MKFKPIGLAKEWLESHDYTESGFISKPNPPPAINRIKLEEEVVAKLLSRADAKGDRLELAREIIKAYGAARMRAYRKKARPTKSEELC